MRGLGDACRALEAPIVGGNVSLYNEGPSGPIYPTPVIGMVGRLPDALRAGRLGFQRAGEEIALVGPFDPSLAASELEKLRGEPLPDGLPGDRPRRRPHARRSRFATRFARGCSRAPTTSPRAAWRSRWPSAAWPVTWARRSSWERLLGSNLACGAGSADRVAGFNASDRCLFGEGPGGFVVSGRADALRDAG